MICVLREKHEVPVSIERRLRSAGGVNRYGEPNYRAVWGWSRLGWIGGKWTDRDGAGDVVRETVELREVPKYVPHDRWHIERWMPPESYGSPGAWYASTIEREGGVSVPALGPYPDRGEYEHCLTLESPLGEFVQLTPAVAEYVARAIEFGRLAKSSGERRAAIDQREGKADRDYDSWAFDVLDSAMPAFSGLPHVGVPAVRA
jgi:hypothetical protein